MACQLIILMKLKERIHYFMNDQKLKHKLYVIIFESDTPSGKLFDVVLIGCILASVLLVIIESLKGLPSYLTTPFVVRLAVGQRWVPQQLL